MDPLTTATLFYLGVNLGSALLSNANSKKAGEIEDAQLDLRAQQEALASTQRQYAIEKELTNTLASQIAMFGAQGRGLTGTPTSIQQSSINAAGQASSYEQLNNSFVGNQLNVQKNLNKLNRENKLSTDILKTFSETARLIPIGLINQGFKV